MTDFSTGTPGITVQVDDSSPLAPMLTSIVTAAFGEPPA
jgi:hypothetical protein